MATMAVTARRINVRKNICSKNFFVRVKSMLNLDFYRLFHTPAYYIMLAIAAIVPAMVLTMTGQDMGSEYTSQIAGISGMTGMSTMSAASPYTNVWQVVAPLSPTYVVADMGEYANINMVYIFSGILSSIFIGHDYMSGFVKNVFTVHSKKFDYVISKMIVGIFCTLCMFVTYLFGAIFAGVLSGLSFDVNISGLFFCLLGKIIMAVGFSTLYVTINLFFRRMMGLSITACFFFGTGLPIMAMAYLLGNNAWLNVFLYGSACFASLSAGITEVLVCLICSVMWSAVYMLLSVFILRHRDLA